MFFSNPELVSFFARLRDLKTFKFASETVLVVSAAGKVDSWHGPLGVFLFPIFGLIGKNKIKYKHKSEMTERENILRGIETSF